jgi:hypothetical protein
MTSDIATMLDLVSKVERTVIDGMASACLLLPRNSPQGWLIDSINRQARDFRRAQRRDILLSAVQPWLVDR